MARPRSSSALACAAALMGAASTLAEDAIEYWTNFAIYPKRCVNYNDREQIMYSMFEKSSNHCTDSPIGTYTSDVSNFVDAYVEQAADNAADAGEDYEYPASLAYVECTNEQINGVDYYLKLGCAGDASSKLAINVYTDADCTQLLESEDDADTDDAMALAVQSDLSVSFGKCIPCVIWMDKNDDEIDDQYYVNKQTNAPLCSTMWTYREDCNGKCQLMGKEAVAREGWNKADKVLLSILSLFGFGMLLAIIKKRQRMSNKDALLEQAAISAAGLQQSHILGIFALLILIITMFALLGLKKITWALLLVLNIVLFGYLMKLTVDGSVKETIIGPDGKIVEKDDSDDEDDDDDEEPMSPVSADSPGGYSAPSPPATELPQIS